MIPVTSFAGKRASMTVIAACQVAAMALWFSASAVVPSLAAEFHLTPFAQAAKYRILWSILRVRPASEVRCLVVAPDIGGSPWKKMKEEHAIECAAVRCGSLPKRPCGTS